MSSLLVFLPPEPPTGTTEWTYAATADGRTVASHGSAPATLLPAARGAGAEVVAIVPVQALGWHRVELPRGTAPGSPRLRSALEGLLEEQLLEDTDAVHMALQPGAQPGQPAWVAVCNRAWLRACLQALEAAGRPASRIIPEFAPEGELAVYAIGEPQAAQLVCTSADGVLALPLATSSLAVLPVLADDTPRHAEPAVAALAEHVLQHKVSLPQAPQRWLQSAQSRWDLGQFELASTGRLRAMRKAGSAASAFLYGPQWRAARWATGLLAAAHLVGLNAWAWQEKQALAAKQVAVRGALTTTFPQVKVVVDAPVQMERELTLLRQKAGSVSPRDLEPLMAAAGGALPDGRVPSAVEFAPGELRLRGVTLAPDEESVFNTRLQAAGYRARIEDGTLLVRSEGTP